jgi:hypothetical protein
MAAITFVAVVTAAVSASAQAPGDANCDGRVDVADAEAIVPALFDDSGADCAVGEVNGDGADSAADVPAMLRRLNLPALGGAQISFLGIAGPNGAALSALGSIGDTRVFFRNSGSGFRIVVEGAPGANRVSPGTRTFDYAPTNPNRRPDVQIGCTQALGDGSAAVCAEGVPPVPPPHFNGSQATANALNDLSCNFDVITSSRFACTVDRFQNPNFLGAGTEAQFCLQVTQRLEFPAGDTLCSVQLLDQGGSAGPSRQFIVRVGSGPVPPTFTPTPPATRTPTSTAPVPATATRTRTSTPSTTPDGSTPAPSITATRTRTPTTPVGPSATATPVQTIVGATNSPTHTRTRTPTRSRTPTLTPTRTRTATPGPTLSPTRTATPSSPQGPVVSFFGLARADESLIPRSGTTPEGVSIYTLAIGNGFRIVVEGAPGPSFDSDPFGGLPGDSSYTFGAFDFADLQVQASRDLGDGSAEVCDRAGATAGGIPAIDPPSFQEIPAILSAVNDFSCRFVDGAEAFRGRTNSADSCVQNPPDSGVFNFVHPSTRIQFCAFVDRPMRFPAGETRLTVRLRDKLGNVGFTQEIIVRVNEAP